MIQRKQTLFLIVAFICYALCLFFPIATIASKTMGGDSLLYNLGFVSGDQGIVFAVVHPARRVGSADLGHHLLV